MQQFAHPTDESGDEPSADYARLLADYVTSRGEEALYGASLLSLRFVELGLGPEEIVAIHSEAVERASAGLGLRERVRAASDATQFLLEIMIAYGVQYRAYLEVRERERGREAGSRLDLERQRAEDAERSEREKTDILAAISHELRTPLTAAVGNLALVERRLARGDFERTPELLANVRLALDRLARLTDDLVEASRGDAPGAERAALDVGPLVDAACTLAGPAAEEKGVTLHWDTDDTCRVFANGDAIVTILGNLISNAIRYTDLGGRIEVRSKMDGDELLLSVRDTGIGMDAGEVTFVFDKFYRASQARRVEPGGLGLGLSIVQRLVEAHDGRIEVESAPGVGSTFTVRLLCHAEADRSSDGPSSDDLATARRGN